ncbi:MAG TPA: Uma2 family endonuclease [Gemmataceae bacterium]|jgi:Uma2 family endonuclease|nr:Uma2 family endonuclease [Gemmataceae bacterium]
MAAFRRFSVDEYHKLIEVGILTEDDNLELLDGYLVHKMSCNPPHDATIQKAMKRLFRALPPDWDLRIQSAITLNGSEPEPDLAVVRGDENHYLTRHPGPADIGLVVEVAEATLAGDRADKGRIYAQAAIPCYWIINLVDWQIEVYTGPSGPTATPAYAQRRDLQIGADVALTLDGIVAASIPLRELLP